MPLGVEVERLSVEKSGQALLRKFDSDSLILSAARLLCEHSLKYAELEAPQPLLPAADMEVPCELHGGSGIRTHLRSGWTAF